MKVFMVLAVVAAIASIGVAWAVFQIPAAPDTAGIRLDVVSFGCFGQSASFSIVLTRPSGGEPFVNVDVQYQVMNGGEMVGTHTATYLLSSGEIEHDQATFQIDPGKTCNSDSYSTQRASIVSVRPA